MDIFVKRNEIEEKSHSDSNSGLSKKTVLESIPKDAFKNKNNELAENNTEWRWRIFKFPNKNNEVVEISFKKPNENRIYINNNGEWVSDNVDSIFDKFVIDEYYSYSNK